MIFVCAKLTFKNFLLRVAVDDDDDDDNSDDNKPKWWAEKYKFGFSFYFCLFFFAAIQVSRLVDHFNLACGHRESAAFIVLNWWLKCYGQIVWINDCLAEFKMEKSLKIVQVLHQAGQCLLNT